MYVQFETANLGEKDACALINLLSTLFPPNGQPVAEQSIASPTLQIPALAPTPARQEVTPAAESAAPEPTAEPTPKRRGRRPNAEIAAEAAQTSLTQAAAQTAAVASTATESAKTTDAKFSVANGAAKVIGADELRGLLNGFIQKHSMEDAIAKLREFGCNRVTEALTLAPDKLTQLAEALNG